MLSFHINLKYTGHLFKDLQYIMFQVLILEHNNEITMENWHKNKLIFFTCQINVTLKL